MSFVSQAQKYISDRLQEEKIVFLWFAINQNEDLMGAYDIVTSLILSNLMRLQVVASRSFFIMTF